MKNVLGLISLEELVHRLEVNMKNMEKYLKELCDLAGQNQTMQSFSYAIGLNADTGKLDLCITTKCADCAFGPRYGHNRSRCTLAMINWLFSEANDEEGGD